MAWASLSTCGCAPAGAWKTSLASRMARGSCARDAVGEGVRGGEQGARLVHLGDEAHRQRLVCVRMRPARRISFATGSPTSSSSRQSAPAAAMMPSAGLGVAESTVVGGDAEVGGVGELGAAAERPAVEGRDHGHGQAGDPGEQAGVDALQRVVAAALAQLGDVGAGGEDAARADEDQDAGLAVRARRRPRAARRPWSGRSRCAPRGGSAARAPGPGGAATMRVENSAATGSLGHLDALHEQRRALADADAHRGEAAPGALALHPAEQGDQDAGAGASRAGARARWRRRRR